MLDLCVLEANNAIGADDGSSEWQPRDCRLDLEASLLQEVYHD